MGILSELHANTIKYVLRVILAVACAHLANFSATAQNTPLISGGAGFLTSTKGGSTSYIPTVQPLIAAPLGPHFFVESRATLLQDFFPRGNGQTGYDRLHFNALTYLELDYVANPHLTIVAGEFLTPFGTYNERLTPSGSQTFRMRRSC